MKREVSSPLTAAMLAPLDARCEFVEILRPLTDPDFATLGEFMRENPRVGLSARGESITDLGFLRFFPDLTSLAVSSLMLGSLDGLEQLNPERLQDLYIGATLGRTGLRLESLGVFAGLRRLGLEGPHRGIEVISQLTNLVDLRLRSITMPDLSILTALDQLRLLDLNLGGTRDLTLLPEIGRLEYLELWRIRGLSDISTIGALEHLQYLHLQAMSGIESLPDLHELRSLRGVRLETMKGIRDLTPLRSAPALDELELIDMGHLTPEDLRPLVDHPTLRAASLGLNRDKKNRAARELTGLAPIPHRRQSRRSIVATGGNWD